MKKWLWAPVVGALFLGLTAPIALAGSNPEASIGLHIQDQTTNPETCSAVLPRDCRTFSTSATTVGDYNVYVMISNFDTVGIAGTQFGIEYDDVNGAGFDVTNWITCGDLQFPMSGWPNAGTGTLMTWEPTFNCQGVDELESRAIPICAGVFQVYAHGPDSFRITARPVDGKAKVADCESAEDDITNRTPSRLGMVTLGGQGYNPCSPFVSVEPTTWGSIKTLYEQ